MRVPEGRLTGVYPGPGRPPLPSAVPPGLVYVIATPDPAINRWASVGCPSGTRKRPSGLTVTCRCHYIPRSGRLNSSSGSDSHCAKRSSTSAWRWLSRAQRESSVMRTLRGGREESIPVTQPRVGNAWPVRTSLATWASPATFLDTGTRSVLPHFSKPYFGRAKLLLSRHLGKTRLSRSFALPAGASPSRPELRPPGRSFALPWRCALRAPCGGVLAHSSHGPSRSMRLTAHSHTVARFARCGGVLGRPSNVPPCSRWLIAHSHAVARFVQNKRSACG